MPTKRIPLIEKQAAAARKQRPPKPAQAERWVIMATAMNQALEYMRDLYAALDMVQQISGPNGEVEIVMKPNSIQHVKDKVAEVANVLKTGLKARGAQS